MSIKRNWARTVELTPREELSVPAPAGGGDFGARLGRMHARTAALAEKVRRSADFGRHIRPIGSLWSFTELLGAPDTCVDTHGLSQVLATTKPNDHAQGGAFWDALAPAAKNAPDAAYAFLEAGVIIDDAMTALRAASLSIATAGASSGQTIAGVISTATHGADFDRPPIADFVRALLLLTPDGKLRWIEPAGRRLTTDAGATALAPPGAVLEVADDDTFDAALVSLGTLGVVCALVLEVRPEYGFEERVFETTWADARARLADGSAFGPHPPGADASAVADPGAAYRYLEVLVNPYRSNDDYASGADDTRVARMVSRVARPGSAPRWDRDVNAFGLAMKALINLATGTLTAFRNQVDAIQSVGRTNTHGFKDAHDVYNFGRSRMEKTWSLELALTTEAGAHLQFMDAVLDRFDGLFRSGKRLAGFMSMRFTRGSCAHLALQTGPTADDRFCHVELFALQSPQLSGDPGEGIFDADDLIAESEAFLTAFEDVAEDFTRSGRARLHWGQGGERPESFSASPTRFPRLADFHRVRRRLTGNHRYTCANEWTVRSRVTPVEARFHATGGALPSAPSKAPLDARGLAAAAPVYVPAGGPLPAYVYAVQGDGVVGHAPFERSRPGVARFEAVRSRIDGANEKDDAPAGAVAVGVNRDGRHELFFRSVDGRVRHRFWGRTHPREGWSEESALSGGERFSGDPAVVRAADGFLRVYAVGEDGRVYERRQRAFPFGIVGWGGWDPLSELPGGAVGRPSALRTVSGHVVYVRAADGAVHAATASGADDPSAFAPIGLGSLASDPVAASTSQGTLVLGAAADGTLRSAFRPHDTGTFDSVRTRSLDGVALLPRTQPTLTPILRDRFVAAVVNAHGKVVLTAYRPSAGFVTSPEPLPVHAVSGVAVVPLAGRRVAALTKIAHDLVVVRAIRV